MGLTSLSGLMTKTHMCSKAFPIKPYLWSWMNFFLLNSEWWKNLWEFWPPISSFYDWGQISWSRLKGCKALIREGGHGLSRCLAKIWFRDEVIVGEVRNEDTLVSPSNSWFMHRVVQVCWNSGRCTVSWFFGTWLHQIKTLNHRQVCMRDSPSCMCHHVPRLFCHLEYWVGKEDHTEEEVKCACGETWYGTGGQKS